MIALAVKFSVMAIALAGCSGGSTRPAALAQGPTDALALSVKLVADTTVEIALTNTGSKPRWLRARLDVDDIDIKPVGDGAVISECTGCETIEEGQPLGYRTLQPGESIVVRGNLESCYELKRPGDYTMRIRWVDRTRHRPEPPTGAVPAVGPVESPIVAVHVAARK